MREIVVRWIEEDQTPREVKIITGGNDEDMAYMIQVGGRYRVEPVSRRKTKNRGRYCTLRKIRDRAAAEGKDCCDIAAWVIFEDSGGRGSVELCDLVPADF